jgi:hypothetical protein
LDSSYQLRSSWKGKITTELQKSQILSKEQIYPECKMELSIRTLLKGLALAASSNSKIKWWLKQIFPGNWATTGKRFEWVRTGSARFTEF